ncbi:conserved hypothetical protein [Streptomyces himastatinicus ATCC 53653]|uniref:Uncharacterized protein n=1 Tax=Streptomyces himastatinicus ATCC 53653 TaxID=457427 RepID=D9WIR8_9ACTN|nr:conserved hypothetical protein [Streptomyces himastatinicus ATCC 53653]
MRRLDVEGNGEPYSLVLRSFVKPFFLKASLGLLSREADVLRLLADTDVPAARLHACACRKCHPPCWEVVRAVYRRSTGEVAKTGALARLALTAAR